MSFNNRLLTFSILFSAGLLTACATPNEAVITRASQIDEAIGQRHEICRDNTLGERGTKTPTQQTGGQELPGNWTRVCPDQNAELVERRNGGLSRAVADASPGEADAGNRASGDDNGATNDGSAGTGTGGGDRSSGGASGSGGTSNGSSTSGGSGDSTGTGSGGKGGSKGGGSKANNGGGNGSEGHSPGRGRGANNDEG